MNTLMHVLAYLGAAACFIVLAGAAGLAVAWLSSLERCPHCRSRLPVDWTPSNRCPHCARPLGAR